MWRKNGYSLQPSLCIEKKKRDLPSQYFWTLFWSVVRHIVPHSFGICVLQNLFSGKEFIDHMPTNSFYYLSSGSCEEAVSSGTKQTSYNRGSLRTSLASGRNWVLTEVQQSWVVLGITSWCKFKGCLIACMYSVICFCQGSRGTLTALVTRGVNACLVLLLWRIP